MPSPFTGIGIIELILAGLFFGFGFAAGEALFNGVLSLFGRRP